MRPCACRPTFASATSPFRDALIEDYALGLAPDSLFELMSLLVGGERRQKAKALAKGEDPDGDAATLDVLAVLEKFAPVHPDPEAFLECLEALQPRLYSISSSPLATPGQVHLTVDAVRYEAAGRSRSGVASTFLADRLKPGARVKAYIQKAHGFSLPPDGSTPIIMVGPGTGIAPFRSFLWQRKTTKARGARGCSSAISTRQPTSSIVTRSRHARRRDADAPVDRLVARRGGQGLRAGPHASRRAPSCGPGSRTARISTSAATPSAWPGMSRMPSPRSRRRPGR